MTDAPNSRHLLNELASRLSATGVAGELGAVDSAGQALLLRIARDIAHATERQNAPLAAYLIGRFVQDAVRSGMSEGAAIEEAAAVVRSLIGETAG